MKFKIALKLFLVTLICVAIFFIVDIPVLNLICTLVGGAAFLAAIAFAVGFKSFMLIFAVYGGALALILLLFFLA